ELGLMVGIPLLFFVIFLGLWNWGAAQIQTSLGVIPGPALVAAEAQNLWAEHRAEREKEAAFMTRQEERNAARLAADPNTTITVHAYTGKPTYVDQIGTSLLTV